LHSVLLCIALFVALLPIFHWVASCLALLSAFVFALRYAALLSALRFASCSAPVDVSRIAS
jgi:hypothetical protein